jgi:predicted HNH restriction endonuclease
MFEAEIVLAIMIGAWILYELYGRFLLESLGAYSGYIRMAGGIAVIGYLYWQLRDRPDEFKDTLDLAKQLMRDGSAAYSSKEKRNVTGLTKKKVAADQGWKCGNCGQTLDETYEVDHKLALFKGGSNNITNLVALCPHCHRKKTVDERLKS